MKLNIGLLSRFLLPLVLLLAKESFAQKQVSATHSVPAIFVELTVLLSCYSQLVLRLLSRRRLIATGASLSVVQLTTANGQRFVSTFSVGSALISREESSVSVRQAAPPFVIMKRATRTLKSHFVQRTLAPA